MSFWKELGKLGGALIGTAGSVAGSLIPGNVGSAITAGSSALSGAFGQKSSNDTYLQGIDKTNQTNLALARQQNDWNIDMYERSKADNKQQLAEDRAYNDPSAQMQRLRDAGINPMLAQASVTNTESTGFQTTPLQSSELSNQQAPGLLPSLDQTATAMQAMQMQAQIANLIQDTRGKEIQNVKTEKEVDILTSDAKFRDALNQGELDLKYSTIMTQSQERDTSKENIELMRKQATNLDQQTQNLIESLENIKANTALVNENYKARLIENMFSPQKFRAEIKKLYTDISKEQMDMLVSEENINALKTLVKGYVIDNQIKSVNLKLANGSVLLQKGEMSAMSAGLQKLKFDIEHQDVGFGVDMLSKFLTSGAAVVGAGTMLKKALNKATGVAPVYAPVTSPYDMYNNTSWSNPQIQ